MGQEWMGLELEASNVVEPELLRTHMISSPSVQSWMLLQMGTVDGGDRRMKAGLGIRTGAAISSAP
jgi:hypothetical protein